MKRLFALLLLVVAPAFAQEYTPGPYIQPPPPPAETENLIYTTLNPPPPGTNFTWTGFINLNTGGGGLSGGNIPAYNSQTGTFLFGYAWGTVNYNLFDTNEFPPNGTQIDSFKYSWEYFNQDFSRGTLSANIKFYDPNNNILNDYNFQLPQTTNGWTLFGGEIGFANPYDISDIGRIQVSFTGKDDRFWAGYYGPQVRALDLSLVYSTPPLDTNFLYWDKLTDEWGLFTLTQPGVVRYGADGVYLYKEFQPGTYACTNGDWGSDPIGGVFKSCSLGSNEAPVVAVDCATNPADPSCIIDSLVDTGVVDPVEQAIADATDMTDEETGIDTGSDDGSSDGTDVVEDEEPVVVAEETTQEAVSLEEVLQDESVDEEETVVAESATEAVAEKVAEPTTTSVAAIVDESKANELADSISKNVLEGALAIAADNTAAASTTSAASVTTSSDSSSRTTIAAASAVVAAAVETVATEIKVEETKTEMAESAVAAIDALEVGRLLGRDALAVTMAATETSAVESIAQAEAIASGSSETQTIVASTTETNLTAAAEEQDRRQTILEKTEDNLVENVSRETTVESQIVSESAIVVAENKEETVEDNKEVQLVVEETNTSVATESASEVVMVAETTIEIETTQTIENQSEQIEEEKIEIVQVAETQTAEQIDSFAELMQLDIKPVTEEKKDEDLEFVQQVVASSQEQKQEENNNSGFSEDEKVTIANDPALANAFNVSPNITNLEVAGVLNNKQEEKSDAEKQADKVVAANAKEQEEINKNYMDADQSGIVAAMGADTDVSAYRTAMLNDNNIWYRPEDIYKNIVYKDNVRGAYFLEKGNTDTYKKMVEEQYK